MSDIAEVIREIARASNVERTHEIVDRFEDAVEGQLLADVLLALSYLLGDVALTSGLPPGAVVVAVAALAASGAAPGEGERVQ